MPSSLLVDARDLSRRVHQAPGVHVQHKENWIFVVPALIIEEEQLRDGLNILDEVLDATDRACRRRRPAGTNEAAAEIPGE